MPWYKKLLIVKNGALISQTGQGAVNDGGVRGRSWCYL